MNSQLANVSAAGTVPTQIGGQIRKIRKLRRMSLVQLGERSGVSASFLSQFERGLCNASFASLRSITNVLGVTLSELLDREAAREERVLRAADRPVVLDGPVRKFMLSLPPLETMEIFLGEFDPGASTGPEAYRHGDSQEFLFVSRGQVTVHIDGRKNLLTEGDIIEYRSSQVHRTHNSGDSLAQVLWIVSPVTVSADEIEAILGR